MHRSRELAERLISKLMRRGHIQKRLHVKNTINVKNIQRSIHRI